ncbi:MAG: Hsp70 family protein [Spirochaetales bacterium]|nr:Hsp70 family protein [Spirochaetales bacterium]
MIHYAIDFGTTNTVVTCWDNESDSVKLIELPGISRGDREHEQSVRNRHAIPSAIYIGDLKRRFLFFKRRRYFIGVQALAKDLYSRQKRFLKNLKPAVMQNDRQTLSTYGKKTYSAGYLMRLFLEEVLKAIQKYEGDRPKSLTISVPVDSYEPYRARLKQIGRQLKLQNIRLIDEPVAAAIGYGMRIDRPQNVLVFDFGGGTMDIALVQIEDKMSSTGRCRVLAKAGLPVGGNNVDRWLADYFCEQTRYELDRDDETGGMAWDRLLLEEARRIKEGLYTKTKETFYLVPPEEYQNFEHRLYAQQKSLDRLVDVSRETLVELISKNGLYRAMDALVAELLERAAHYRITKEDIATVLMVGGSSLLPGVYPRMEQAFGRAKVQAWQPFNAVSYGACQFGAQRVITSDFIVHDYAFVTHDAENYEPQYNVIIPRNTPFPTVEDFWKHRVVPTCAQGLPEKIFKLLVCEIGRNRSRYQEFHWDAQGAMHSLEGEADRLIIPLNEDNPVLGTLNPPHQPGNREARLEIAFMINGEKWLCATVKDLLTGELLMQGEEVVQLR